MLGVADAVAAAPLDTAESHERTGNGPLGAVTLTPPDWRRWRRVVVLATSHDDATASPEREPGLSADDYPIFMPILPSADETDTAAPKESKAASFATEDEGGSPFFACGVPQLNIADPETGKRRITRPVATNADGTPACRVQARLWPHYPELAPGCDPARGWSGPVEPGVSWSGTGDRALRRRASHGRRRCEVPRSPLDVRGLRERLVHRERRRSSLSRNVDPAHRRGRARPYDDRDHATSRSHERVELAPRLTRTRRIAFVDVLGAALDRADRRREGLRLARNAD